MKTVKWVHSDSKQAGKTLETLTRLISSLDLPLQIKVTYTSEEKLTKALEVAESALKKYIDTSVRGWAMEDKIKDIFVAEYALEQINRIKNVD